jgi:hypothetical protein
MTALALLASLTPVVAMACVGWHPSAMARMACCAKVPGDVTATQADDCCGAGEQRAHSRLNGGAMNAVLPDVQTRGTAPLTIDRVGTRRLNTARHRAPEVATHLLVSVFLL